MSDRYNEALEAAAKACRNEKFLAVRLIGEQYNDACDDCAKAILALREADQRGAQQVSNNTPNATADPQSAPHPDMVLVPRKTMRLIRLAFLPANPNRMRAADPDVVAAAREFIALAAGRSRRRRGGPQCNLN